MPKDFLYCEETDTKIFSNDVVSISTYPNTKWIAKQGWYIMGSARKHGWYFVSISDKTIIPIDLVDISDITKDVDRNHTTTIHESSTPSVTSNVEPAVDYLFCEATATVIYPNDIVEISDVQYVAKYGWYTFEEEQHKGWYFLSVEDRITLPLSKVDLDKVTKLVITGTSEYRPTLQDMDSNPPELNYIVIPDTNIRLYDGDIVKISNNPEIKWVVHSGWYIYQGVQNFGWYFVSIKNGEILPVSIVDLTLVSLVTTKTQGSNKYDGKVVNYTRPFTLADADVLNRTFITVDTIQQRDNLDQTKLVEGRLVRVNDVGGVVVYYSWDSATSSWIKADFGGGGGSGIPQIIGTSEKPIILSSLESGLYRVLGTYKISPNTKTTTFTSIDHIVFVSDDNDVNIKIITDSDITDYIVSEDEVAFIDKYATQGYVDNKIEALEAQISQIISEFDERVLEIVNERLDFALDRVSEQYINNLFNE